MLRAARVTTALRRRATQCLAVIAVVAFLGSCSGTGDDGKVTLTYWTFSDFTLGTAGELQHQLIRDFETEHPNVDVEIVGKTGSDIVSGIVASAGQSSGPDVVTAQLAAGGPLAAAGALKDLAPYWDAAPADYRDQFNPAFVSPLSGDGAVWGVPYTSYATILYRNLTVLENAGIDPGEDIEDWADWSRQMREVHANGDFAIANPFNTYWESLSYYGGTADASFALAPEGGSTLSPDGFGQALGFMQEALPFGSDVRAGDQAETDLFTGNELAFIVSGPWLNPTLAEAADNSGLRYDFVPVPGQSAGGAGGTRGGEFMAVTVGSQHPEESWEFIRYMTEQAQTTKFAVGLGRTVANDAAMSSPEASAVPLLEVTSRSFASAVDESPLMADIPNDAFDELNAALTEVENGADPRVQAERAVRAFNEAVAEAN